MVNEYKNKIIHGNCLNVLKRLPSNSVDSVVTDPPYGLSKEPDIREVLTKWINGEPYDHGHKGFMGKSWDSFVPHPDIWKEVYRVLKPGGHALVFAGTRTQDLMTISLRLAGFEVRDVIEWLYATGFPKSHNVSKAFDKRAGAEREVIGQKWAERYPNGPGGNSFTVGGEVDGTRTAANTLLTAPATDLARKWDGWGTATKPSHEPIIVVRKPLIDADTGRKLTVVDCVEKYGTGAINIDASRIHAEDQEELTKAREDFAGRDIHTKSNSGARFLGSKDIIPNMTEGRFPANCITLDSDEFYSKYFNVSPAELSKKASKKDRNSDWQGEEITLEPKERFDLEGGEGYRIDRFNTLPTANNHPTVKPTDLMAWLVRLVTPPQGAVLDPFAGSESTCVAAKREGFNYIGIEMEPEYVEIAKARTGEAV